MPHVARAQGQVCAQNPTTAIPTRQQWFSNGSNPFQDAPHPCQDAPHPPPERPNLAGEFLGRRATWDRRPSDLPKPPWRVGRTHEEATRLPVSSGRSGVRGLGCPLSWMSFVLDAFCLGCLLSWMLAVVGLLGHGDARRVLISPCLGVPARPGRLTPAVSRASSRSEARAEAVGVGSSAWLNEALRAVSVSYPINIFPDGLAMQP
jgi:hypothetical protein